MYCIWSRRKTSTFCLIFHCNYPSTETIMSCEDTLHINFRQLSQWMGMLWGPDRPLWESVLSIWFGMVQIARVKQFLIKSQWKCWLDLVEHWVSVRRRSLLTFLRKPWNPLSCNSITIPLRGGKTLLLPPDNCRSLFIGTWGDQHWSGQSESHIWGTKVSFHTWTAIGCKSLNSITEIASANTYRHTKN